MDKFKNIPLENIEFLLNLWDNPDMRFVLAGPAALNPTRSLYELGFLIPKGKVKDPFEYGTQWALNREAFTLDDIREMKSIRKEFYRVN